MPCAMRVLLSGGIYDIVTGGAAMYHENAEWTGHADENTVRISDGAVVAFATGGGSEKLLSSRNAHANRNRIFIKDSEVTESVYGGRGSFSRKQGRDCQQQGGQNGGRRR